MLAELILAATALNGLLAGASLDQSIKQLPSRHRIGVSTYAAYVRGADLGPGVLWYAVLANSAVLATVTAGLLSWRADISEQLTIVLSLAAVSSLAHSGATFRAAPTLFSARKVPLDDETALTRLFDRFARWQAIRAALQLLTFALSLWSLKLALNFL